MQSTQRSLGVMCLALAAASVHGIVDARSVTVSAGGGPGSGRALAACTSATMSVAADACTGFDESWLSVERTNLWMDIYSGVLGQAVWTDRFSEAIDAYGKPYTPFVQQDDVLLGAGAGSSNDLFDAVTGVSDDGNSMVGTLTLLRGLNRPFILGLSVGTVGASINFSGLFVYADQALAAGDTLSFSMPISSYTLPTPSNSNWICGSTGGSSGYVGGVSSDGNGNVTSDGTSSTTTTSTSTSSPCTPPPQPTFPVRFNAVTIFEDVGQAVPLPGTLGLAALGLGLLGWSRRQRAAAIAAR